MRNPHGGQESRERQVNHWHLGTLPIVAGGLASGSSGTCAGGLHGSPIHSRKLQSRLAHPVAKLSKLVGNLHHTPEAKVTRQLSTKLRGRQLATDYAAQLSQKQGDMGHHTRLTSPGAGQQCPGPGQGLDATACAHRNTRARRASDHGDHRAGRACQRNMNRREGHNSAATRQSAPAYARQRPTNVVNIGCLVRTLLSCIKQHGRPAPAPLLCRLPDFKASNAPGARTGIDHGRHQEADNAECLGSICTLGLLGVLSTNHSVHSAAGTIHAGSATKASIA